MKQKRSPHPKLCAKMNWARTNNYFYQRTLRIHRIWTHSFTVRHCSTAVITQLVSQIGKNGSKFKMICISRKSDMPLFHMKMGKWHLACECELNIAPARPYSSEINSISVEAFDDMSREIRLNGISRRISSLYKSPASSCWIHRNYLFLECHIILSHAMNLIIIFGQPNEMRKISISCVSVSIAWNIVMGASQKGAKGRNREIYSHRRTNAKLTISIIFMRLNHLIKSCCCKHHLGGES